MASHVRLTPDEYDAVSSACRAISLVGSYRAFQDRLAASLLGSRPGLARKVAAFSLAQARTLRFHFERAALRTRKDALPRRRPIG
jgi:hypothetical protein